MASFDSLNTSYHVHKFPWGIDTSSISPPLATQTNFTIEPNGPIVVGTSFQSTSIDLSSLILDIHNQPTPDNSDIFMYYIMPGSYDNAKVLLDYDQSNSYLVKAETTYHFLIKFGTKTSSSTTDIIYLSYKAWVGTDGYSRGHLYSYSGGSWTQQQFKDLRFIVNVDSEENQKQAQSGDGTLTYNGWPITENGMIAQSFKPDKSGFSDTITIYCETDQSGKYAEIPVTCELRTGTTIGEGALLATTTATAKSGMSIKFSFVSVWSLISKLCGTDKILFRKFYMDEVLPTLTFDTDGTSREYLTRISGYDDLSTGEGSLEQSPRSILLFVNDDNTPLILDRIRFTFDFFSLKDLTLSQYESTTSINVSYDCYSNNTLTADGVVIFRTKEQVLTGIDGTKVSYTEYIRLRDIYIAEHGAPALDENVFYSLGTSGIYTDTGLTLGQIYYYHVFPYKGPIATRTYGSGIWDSYETGDITPPDSPGNFRADINRESAPYKVILSWDNPPIDFDYVLLKKSYTSFPAIPTDGTLVYQGKNSFVIEDYTSADKDKKVYYSIWTYDFSGNYSTPNGSFAVLGDPTTPQPVTAVTVTKDSSLVHTISWTNPSSFSVVRLILKSGVSVATTYSPSTPTEGTILYTGALNTFTYTFGAGDLGETFTYTLFVKGTNDEITTPSFATGDAVVDIVGDNTPPPPASELEATSKLFSIGSQVELKWKLPVVSGKTIKVKIIRTEQRTVEAPDDGYLLYDGSNETFIDIGTGLSNGLVQGTVYYYTFFCYDTSGNVSSAASITSYVGNQVYDIPKVSSFTVAGSQDSDGAYVVVSWQKNNLTSIKSTVVIRKSGVIAPANNLDGLKVYDDTGTSFTDWNVNKGSIYSYSSFNKDDSNEYSDPVSYTVVAGDVTPPSSPTAFSAERYLDTDKKLGIKLKWKNPTQTDVKGIVIIRKEGTVPSIDYDDGIIIESKNYPLKVE